MNNRWSFSCMYLRKIFLMKLPYVSQLSGLIRSGHRRYSKKQVFLKISQNSQENTCARVSFNKIADLHLSYRTSSSDWFWLLLNMLFRKILQKYRFAGNKLPRRSDPIMFLIFLRPTNDFQNTSCREYLAHANFKMGFHCKYFFQRSNRVSIKSRYICYAKPKRKKINRYLATTQPNLGHCWHDILTNPMLNIAF